MAEQLGYDSIWTAEASGTDAVSPLAWVAAHTEKINIATGVMQLTARCPTTTAMTAATLDLLSEGRFILGLGASGPAVVEGWHAQRYGSPLARTREYMRIVRDVWTRQPVEAHGAYYDIPYRRADSTGLADPIRLMFRPRRKSIPIYLAAMGPRNVGLAYEIADGVIPAFYSPYRESAFFAFSAEQRTARRGVELAPFVSIAMGSNIDACRDRLKPGLAFWLGGMGARGLNYYNNFVSRLGFGAQARVIQDLYTRGLRAKAAAAVPDTLVDEVALFGPREHVADQLAAWRESSVTTLILTHADVGAIRAVAELVL